MVAFPITHQQPQRSAGQRELHLSGARRHRLRQRPSCSVASDPIAFSLNDTVAPRIVNTTVNGRIMTIRFSEAVRASTINPTNLILVRAGSDGSFGKPSNVNLSNDPRLKLTYDPATFTATARLQCSDQSQFPTDQYALVVLAGDNGSTGVVDLAGNFLDGEFNGVFPSGNGTPRG